MKNEFMIRRNEKEVIGKNDEARKNTRDLAAVTIFQALIGQFKYDGGRYKNSSQYRADIKVIANMAWEYADVFMDSYGKRWDEEELYHGFS